MIHNPSTRRQNYIPNASRRQELIDPFLQVGKSDVETWRDDATFVQTTVELDDDFTGTMVIDFLEFADVAWM
jgi:hypothetical protein